MLKFGFKHNNFYPIMLLIFIFLRKCMDILLKLHPYKNNIDFIIPFLIFSSQSLIGYLIHLYYYKKNILEKKNNNPPAKIGSITLITNKTYANRDNKIKRLSLIRVPIRMTGESAFAEDLLYMIVCLCASRPSREAADLPR